MDTPADPAAGPAAGTAAAVHALLLERGWTVATAESVTGGALGALLSATPGASGTYRGGVVCYATDLKQSLLGVEDAVVAGPGVVSAECAAQMASGVRRLAGATVGVSTTGVAGPDPQEDKPVGLVHVAVALPDAVRTWELRLSGDRTAIREQACAAAVRAVWATLVGDAV